MKRLPGALVALRLVLGPVLLVLLLQRAPWPWLVGVLMAAFLSDVFDGIVARRLGVATEALRRADSLVDTVFYVFVVVGAALQYWDTVEVHALGLAMLIGLELVRHAVDLGKFGRSAAYHMWSAKLWGVGLLAAFVELFVMGAGGALFQTAIVLGILTNGEGFAASLLLKQWHHDVPSLWHAWAIRHARAEME